MTKESDLSGWFAGLAEPALPEFNGRFGRLDALASWLVATAVPPRKREPTDLPDRQLILIGDDYPVAHSLSLPPGVYISRYQQSNPPSVDHEIQVGIQLADQAIDSGIALLFLSSQKTETPQALEILVGALTRTDAASVAARQDTGDAEWMENVTYIRDEIFVLRDRIGDPSALLTHTKSFAIAALVGVILESAKRSTPVVLIGEAASCAALIASRISHPARAWTAPALDLTTPIGALTQRHLDRQPILELGMEFGHDYLTPVAMTMPIIDALLALLAT
jgi:NaMN:DMB phosphoribosyltransferase